MSGVVKLDSATPAQGGIQIPIDRSRWPTLDEAYRSAMVAFVDEAAKDLA
jgi:hypothetical protein